MPDRRMLIAALLLVAGAAGAQPRDPGPAMVQVVLDQLAAFRRGDWPAAYGFASSAIRAQFAPDAFREMVTRGYAPIARSASATVRRVDVLDPRRGLVEMRVEGQDGERIDALYEVVREPGGWRINGVLARPAEPGVTASAPPGRPPSTG
jgi:hypothetical protein